MVQHAALTGKKQIREFGAQVCIYFGFSAINTGSKIDIQEQNYTKSTSNISLDFP